MVRTIVNSCMNAKYRESGKDTCLGCFLDTSADCRDIFLWNRTADNRGIKLEYFFTVCIHWLKFNFTMSVLSTSTGLFCIFVFLVNRLCKCLFVSNLRSTYVCFYFKFTKQTVYDNLQMQLAHTSDNRLSCFRVCMRAERRIFFCKLGKRLAHFALSGFCFRLDCKLDNRFREFH